MSVTGRVYGYDVLRGVLAALSDETKTDDYAPGVDDVFARLKIGAKCLDHLSEPLKDQWFGDLDVFVARARRHEYSKDQIREIRAVSDLVIQSIQSRKAEVAREIERLEGLLADYQQGPVHLVAMDQQWRAYRFCQACLKSAQMAQQGALQSTTVECLRAAETYSWSAQMVEAVASVAQALPAECAPSPTALGELAFPGKAGWWWFEKPVPIQTTAKPHESVVALLWRRETHLDIGSLVWFSLFVKEVTTLDGRRQVVPEPTCAWTWLDGMPIGVLPQDLKAGFEKGSKGRDHAGYALSEAAALWFSRFFLAAAMWLRQRVAVTTPGGGVRQVARQIQRQHKLDRTPSVQLIELRRRETVTHEQAPDESDTAGPRREYSCRWVVHGFTRNQWYPRAGVHAPKWIDSYEKGPVDKPLRVTSRVYAVRR